MNSVLLKVKHLNVDLGGEDIIKDLSFHVNQGEILTILGPNGSGKSVLVRTLLGFLPHKGTIHWAYKGKIGYLPQGLNQLLLKDLPLTVRDFFDLKDSSPKNEDILHYLSLVGLGKDVLHKIAGNLSGGEFQRVLLAWILISRPKVLILDEPTTGIDLGGGETIYSLLEKIRQEKHLTIILITHDLNVVYGFTDNVLCLSRKGHVCSGPPHKVMSPETLEKIFGEKIKFYKHQ